MDEAITIYNPRSSYLAVAKQEKPKPRYEKESWKKTLKRVFDEQRKQEKELNEKYPMIIVFYRWFIVAVIIALFVSFIGWRLDIRTDRKAAALTATAMADYQAEQQALADAEADKKAEEAKKLAESEAVIEQNVCTKLALVYQGADKFVDKYGYGERDFKSLGRCIFNRTENPAYPDDIIEVIDQPDQWVGYYAQNITPMDKYYQMAVKHYREWKSETTKPISNDYLWAEYTSKGIFLKYKYDAGPYDPRWRAEA